MSALPEVVHPNLAAARLSRRGLLGGFAAGTTAALWAGELKAAPLPPEQTTTSPEGIVRTLLERAEDADGRVFELILDTFPPGIVVPVHHHPVVALNYVLSGTAESRYEGEPMRLLKAGDTFQDHPDIPHLHFRNPDPVNPVVILITHALKPGQSFFVPGRA